MKFISEMKKRGRVISKQQANQGLRTKMIFRMGAGIMLLLCIGFTVFLIFTKSHKTKAEVQAVPAWAIVKEQEYVTAMSIAEPVITHATIDAKAIQFRIPKAQNSSSH